MGWKLWGWCSWFREAPFLLLKAAEHQQKKSLWVTVTERASSHVERVIDGITTYQSRALAYESMMRCPAAHGAHREPMLSKPRPCHDQRQAIQSVRLKRCAAGARSSPPIDLGGETFEPTAVSALSRFSYGRFFLLLSSLSLSILTSNPIISRLPHRRRRPSSFSLFYFIVWPIRTLIPLGSITLLRLHICSPFRLTVSRSLTEPNFFESSHRRSRLQYTSFSCQIQRRPYTTLTSDFDYSLDFTDSPLLSSLDYTRNLRTTLIDTTTCSPNLEEEKTIHDQLQIDSGIYWNTCREGT